MNLLDIIGPVMVGPSSSHTAGAVRIGRVSRKLLAEEVKEAKIYFHGSFLATGKGHGTDKALIAGLLGMQVDDPAIPDSFRIAEKRGMRFSLEGIDLGVLSLQIRTIPLPVFQAVPVGRTHKPEQPLFRLLPRYFSHGY